MKIREARKQRGMTLAVLSGMVGVSIAYLSDIEKGNRHGSAATKEKIAAALGIPVTELEDG